MAATLAVLPSCGASDRSESESYRRPEGTGGNAGSGGTGGGTGGAPRGGGGSGGGISVESAGAGGDCEREVTLQAVVLGEPAPFDLVIVADHSGSLAWSRDELSTGLEDLLTNVQGRSVRVFLLTPTQYGASSAAARIPLSGDPVVAWQDPETGDAYEPAVTLYEQTCTDKETSAIIECPDPSGNTPYVVEGTWRFAMPDPIAVVSPDMTAAEFAAQQAAVRESILALGGTGSPNEQPLCTLSRYVSQDPAVLPENVVFLILSDEDDVSVPDDCLTSYRGELLARRVEIGSTACSSDCDVYRYRMEGIRNWERHPFTCAAFSDTGEPIPGTEMMSWYNLGVVPSCDDIDVGPCTDAERAEIQQFCASGLRVTSCERECFAMDFPCTLDLPDGDIDACTESFTYAGSTWENLPEYCAQHGSGYGACTGQGLNLEYEESVAGTSRPENLMPGTTTDSVASYFKSMALSVFGQAGFLMEGILFDPAYSCTLGHGQSYGTNLARAIGDPSHVFSLCESYAPALRGVLDFAEALIQTEFVLTLKDDEQVSTVVVIANDGGERTLPATDYAFDEATQVLSIEPSAIRATDANLRVEVTSDCRPIIR